MSRLKELEEEFEHGKGGPDYRRGSRLNVTHIVTAPDFIKQLMLLAEATCDYRFISALEAIAQGKMLTPGGGWKRDMYYYELEPLYQEWDDMLFQHVERLQQAGCSFQTACAEAVVALELNAHSFDAAVKYVERVCRFYRESGLTLQDIEDRLDCLPETLLERRRLANAIRRDLDRLSGRPERPDPIPVSDEKLRRRATIIGIRLGIMARRRRETGKKLSNDT